MSDDRVITTGISVERLDKLFNDAHRGARDAGWWHDLETGKCLDRNRGELIALIHSEISEAESAEIVKAMDDKLPHRRGAEVELADVLIRIGDYAEGFGFHLTPHIRSPRPGAYLGGWAATMHRAVTDVLEAERKGQIDVSERLAVVVELVFGIAVYRGYDVMAAAEEKLAFNKHRADHKPENRRQAGGKKF